MSQEEIEREVRMQQMANREELEKVKKRRQEREAEKEAREEETSQLQRTREAEQFREWQEHEDEFHLKQAELRSRIRIQVPIYMLIFPNINIHYILMFSMKKKRK